jgi:CHAT domain-containing protein/tetratricopeptide (TPR) repeat protein
MFARVRPRVPAVTGLLISLACCSHETPEIAYQRAESQYYHAKYKAARATAESQLRFWRNRPEREWNWKFRNLLAEILLATGKADQAADQLQGHANTPEDEARRSINLALAKHAMARRGSPDDRETQLLDQEADRLLTQAESLISDPELLARAGQARGNFYLDQENFTGAESSYLRVRGLAEQLSPFRKVRYWINFGHLRLLQYRFEDAMADFEQARRLSQEMGDRRAEQVALGNLGVCHSWSGDYRGASELFAQAEGIAAQISDNDSRAKWLVLSGVVCSKQRNFQQAFKFYQTAQRLNPAADPEWQTNIYNNLAESALEMKDFAAARIFYEQALQLCTRKNLNRLLQGTKLNGARLARATGDDDTAEKLLLEVTGANPNDLDQADLWEAHYRLASLQLSKGKPEEADRHYRTALKLIGDVLPNVNKDDLKYTFLDSLISFSQEYVSFLMDQNKRDTAFEVAESAHAHVLRDKIRAGSVPGPRGILAGLKRAVQGTKTVLFSYWLDDSRSVLWVVSADGFKTFELPSGKDIQTHVERYVGAIANHRNVLATHRSDGEWLYQHLVGPAQDLISTDSDIIIAPDGCLHSLNFETLPVVQSGDTHYWIEDVTVSVTPSLSLLGRPEPSTQPNLLLIGDPAFESAEFPRLADAAVEMKFVQQYFTSQTVHRGPDATPQAYLDSQPEKFSTIHFTGHARADCEHPLNSAIILAPGGDHEGERGNLLYAHDIASRRLKADLVTLSGCKTAGCKTYSGEGLTGLAWAFLSAGAHNVVAGLWNIMDATAPRLMDDFYAERQRGKTPAQAMRIAKRKLLSSSGMNNKPYYWAPFEVFTRDLKPAGLPARTTAVLSAKRLK